MMMAIGGGEAILSDWMHHSLEQVIPNELNITQMAQQSSLLSSNVSVQSIVHVLEFHSFRDRQITIKLASCVLMSCF